MEQGPPFRNIELSQPNTRDRYYDEHQRSPGKSRPTMIIAEWPPHRSARVHQDKHDIWTKSLASWLWLVPFQWNGKTSICHEWETILATGSSVNSATTVWFTKLLAEPFPALPATIPVEWKKSFMLWMGEWSSIRQLCKSHCNCISDTFLKVWIQTYYMFSRWVVDKACIYEMMGWWLLMGHQCHYNL